MSNRLELTVHPWQEPAERMGFVCRHLYNAGFAGKQQDEVRKHIEELAALGVPAPSSTPTIFPLSDYNLSTADEIQVQHGETSGEVEYVLLLQGGEVYVTVGSDQSDRNLESYSISKAKQACLNVMAGDVWLYEEVKDHWDQLYMRCWVTKDGQRSLYQEDRLEALLSPEEWFPVWNRLELDTTNFCFFSGTISTIGGLVYGDCYELELEDPVLGRVIRHSYQVTVLKPGVE